MQKLNKTFTIICRIIRFFILLIACNFKSSCCPETDLRASETLKQVVWTLGLWFNTTVWELQRPIHHPEGVRFCFLSLINQNEFCKCCTLYKHVNYTELITSCKLSSLSRSLRIQVWGTVECMCGIGWWCNLSSSRRVRVFYSVWSGGRVTARGKEDRASHQPSGVTSAEHLAYIRYGRLFTLFH